MEFAVSHSQFSLIVVILLSIKNIHSIVSILWISKLNITLSIMSLLTIYEHLNSNTIQALIIKILLDIFFNWLVTKVCYVQNLWACCELECISRGRLKTVRCRVVQFRTRLAFIIRNSIVSFLRRSLFLSIHFPILQGRWKPFSDICRVLLVVVRGKILFSCFKIFSLVLLKGTLICFLISKV